MRIIFRILLLVGIVIQTAVNSFAISITSWNLENFGKSKTDSAIEFIANTLKDYDVIAIQEIVAGYGGSQTVAKLSDALNRKGFKWDYTISNPTS